MDMLTYNEFGIVDAFQAAFHSAPFLLCFTVLMLNNGTATLLGRNVHASSHS